MTEKVILAPPIIVPLLVGCSRGTQQTMALRSISMAQSWLKRSALGQGPVPIAWN
jgi:hypothetical protein